MESDKKKYPSNLAGIEFGHLMAMYIDPEKTCYGKTYWWCQCDCGKQKSIWRSSLVSGNTQSCGHLGLKRLIEHRRTTHGESKTRLYSIWCGVHKRCYNENCKTYKHYGATGIKVEERWHKYESFRDDLKESYDKHVERYGEKNTTIDRIDPKKDYSLDNCRWATMQKQCCNRKTTQALDRKKIGFNQYQYLSTQTAQYPFAGENPYYVVLGLGGEAGEVCDKFKKIMRDKKGIINDHDKNEISKELGDCLWYLSQICEELGVRLEDVALQNIKKLADRKERGVIMGEGDNR